MFGQSRKLTKLGNYRRPRKKITGRQKPVIVQNNVATYEWLPLSPIIDTWNKILGTSTNGKRLTLASGKSPTEITRSIQWLFSELLYEFIDIALGDAEFHKQRFITSKNLFDVDRKQTKLEGDRKFGESESYQICIAAMTKILPTRSVRQKIKDMSDGDTKIGFSYRCKSNVSMLDTLRHFAADFMCIWIQKSIGNYTEAWSSCICPIPT